MITQDQSESLEQWFSDNNLNSIFTGGVYNDDEAIDYLNDMLARLEGALSSNPISINADGNLQEAVVVTPVPPDPGDPCEPLGNAESIFYGGWFDRDGISDPTVGVYTDGWYYPCISIEDIERRLDNLEMLLVLHKPISINTAGNKEEVDIFA